MYSPDSLDQERASWRTVVYFNVARSVKHILDTLESHADSFDDDDPDRADDSAYDSVTSKYTLQRHQDAADGSSARQCPSPVVTESQRQIATLRLRLSPLVAAECTLAYNLTGGNFGKGGVYVRDGWQSRSTPRHSHSRSRAVSAPNYSLPSPIIEGMNSSNVAGAIEEVCRILDASKEDIKTLWRSDVVQNMIKRRRLRLEEWTELSVLSPSRSALIQTLIRPRPIIVSSTILIVSQQEITFRALVSRKISCHLMC